MAAVEPTCPQGPALAFSVLTLLLLCAPTCALHTFDAPSWLLWWQVLPTGFAKTEILTPGWNDSYLGISQGPHQHSGFLGLWSDQAGMSIFFKFSRRLFLCCKVPTSAAWALGWPPQLPLSHLSHTRLVCPSWGSADFSKNPSIWERKAWRPSKGQSGGPCLMQE